MTETRVPVTLLTGFLGSGKTTLLNRILAGDHGERVAVVVNEFGDVDIDGRLVTRREEDLIELQGGCICCTVREDLRTTLIDLAERRQRRFLGRKKFDRVVIEASGMASPGPAVQTLVIDADLMEAYAPAGVVTLCHAGHVVRQLEEHPEAAEQVAYADLLILNHIDQAGELDEVEAALSACNGTARVLRSERADVDLGELLSLRPLDEPGAPLPGHDHHHDHHHDHDHGPGEVCTHVQHTSGAGTVTLRASGPLDRAAFQMWLQFLFQREGMELWRTKGVLSFTGDASAHVVQGVYQWTEVVPSEEPAGESVLVLIGRGLDAGELERGWGAVGS